MLFLREKKEEQELEVTSCLLGPVGSRDRHHSALIAYTFFVDPQERESVVNLAQSTLSRGLVAIVMRPTQSYRSSIDS